MQAYGQGARLRYHRPMNARSLIVMSLLILLAIFAVANWAVFIAPTRLDLVFTSVEAPLGLLMLGFVVTLTLVFSVYVIWVQMAALRTGRQHAEEIRHQRELADQAEASRFTELKQFIESELAEVRGEITTATNTLSAYIGEVDDKLTRRLPGLPPDRMP